MKPFRRLRHEMEKLASINSWGYGHERERWMSKTMSTVLSLLAVLLLAGVIFLAMNFSSYFGKNRNSQSEQIPDAPLQDFERLLTKGSYNELVAYATQNRTDDSSSLPEQLANLKKLIAIADRVIELGSQTPASSNAVAPHTIKIGAIMKLDRLHQQHHLNNEFVESQINNYVVPLLSSSNAEIAGAAHACVCYSSCLRFLNSRSDEDFEEMRQQFLDSTNFAIETPKTVEQLEQIFRLIDPAAPDEGRNKEPLIDLGEKICQSSQPTVQSIGTQLLDQALVAGTDLNLVATEVMLNDTDAIARGIEFINDVAEDSRFGEKAYSTAILMAELIDKMGHHDALEPAVAKLVQSAAKVRRAESRLIIQKDIADFLQRRNLKGKPFRLEAANSKEVDLSRCSGNPVVILFFDSSSPSSQALEAIDQLNYFSKEGVCFVAIDLENTDKSQDQEERENEKADEKRRNQFPRFIFLESEQAVELLRQCPVHHGPFLILLDENHEVSATNVNPDNLRKLLENRSELP